jgi:hypothetical protein
MRNGISVFSSPERDPDFGLFRPEIRVIDDAPASLWLAQNVR